MSQCLDSDQGRHYVGPDLGPNCLQGLSTDDKSACWVIFRVSNGLDPVQTVCHDLVPNCLQRLSADHKKTLARKELNVCSDISCE